MGLIQAQGWKKMRSFYHLVYDKDDTKTYQEIDDVGLN